MSEQSLHNIIIGRGINTDRIKGSAAAILTMCIWSGYFFSLRLGILSPLTVFGLTLIRFSVPGLILLPVFIKSIKKYSEIPVKYCFMIILGGGIPFFLFSLTGMRLSGITFGSTLIPGSIPLFVALLSYIFNKNKVNKTVLFGLSSIASGVVIMIFRACFSGGFQLLAAVVFFLLSGFSWAVFSLNIKKCNLNPIELIAMVAVPSGLLITLIVLIFKPVLGISEMSFIELFPQILTQGIIVGMLAGVSYSYATSKVGPEISSAIGAATPVTATLAASGLPGESVNFISLTGMLFIVLGVIVASGLLNKEKI